MNFIINSQCCVVITEDSPIMLKGEIIWSWFTPVKLVREILHKGVKSLKLYFEDLFRRITSCFNLCILLTLYVISYQLTDYRTVAMASCNKSKCHTAIHVTHFYFWFISVVIDPTYIYLTHQMKFVIVNVLSLEKRLYYFELGRLKYKRRYKTCKTNG